MAGLNVSVVMIVGFVGMMFGFISVIGTMVGLAIWLDRKHSARMDRIDKRIDDLQEEVRGEVRDIREDMREIRGDIREVQRNILALNSKVERAQGSLDVLVFGERGVPPPVAQERAEMQVEETLGD